ncbi:MAG: hypothetical protein MJ207_03865 [Bacilli bacterium]|nr:hypothetical protein [Bacilli bacterium]
MNVSTIYDKSVKMIDECYERLLRIWQLPKGSISKKTINSHNYYYHQYREGKKVITKLIKGEQIAELRKQINERKRLVKLNKNAKEAIQKNVKVIAIFDKGLSASLLDEVYAYGFDEIPVSERGHVVMPIAQMNIRQADGSYTINENLTEYYKQWVKGEIRAREISNFIIQKISD